jgi:hypothetical protein
MDNNDHSFMKVITLDPEPTLTPDYFKDKFHHALLEERTLALIDSDILAMMDVAVRTRHVNVDHVMCIHYLTQLRLLLEAEIERLKISASDTEKNQVAHRGNASRFPEHT